jgi:hypothetical protein
VQRLGTALRLAAVARRKVHATDPDSGYLIQRGDELGSAEGCWLSFGRSVLASAPSSRASRYQVAACTGLPGVPRIPTRLRKPGSKVRSGTLRPAELGIFVQISRRWSPSAAAHKKSYTFFEQLGRCRHQSPILGSALLQIG